MKKVLQLFRVVLSSFCEDALYKHNMGKHSRGHIFNSKVSIKNPALTFRIFIPFYVLNDIKIIPQSASRSSINYLSRVTNLKSEGMQNQPTSVFSVRSTLGKIETMPQIGETLEKVCEIAILNHKQSSGVAHLLLHARA